MLYVGLPLKTVQKMKLLENRASRVLIRAGCCGIPGGGSGGVTWIWGTACLSRAVGVVVVHLLLSSSLLPIPWIVKEGSRERGNVDGASPEVEQ